MATNYSNVLLRFDGKLSLARGSTPVRVRGSNGADTVTIEQGVEAVLDGSFNRGNDVINFAGLASSYTVSKPNSSSILITDAQGTSVTIPVGTIGSTINFADASRTLVGGASGVTLGTQTVATSSAAVAAGSGIVAPFAPNDEVGVLPGANLAQVNTVVLVQGAVVNLGEGTDPTVVRGTNGIDVVNVTAGNVLVLDGSFNRGNDTIKFDGLAEDYQIVRNGSSAVVITDNAGTSVTIPVGVNGTAIEFADVSRELVGGANGLFLGDQQVGSVPAAIADGGTEVVTSFHTLTEAFTQEVESTPPTMAVFWGYNPNGISDDNSTEGPLDGGIPLSELVAFVTTITGLDLAELGLIDDDGTGPFDNVRDLTISNATTLTGSVGDSNSGGPGSVLEISFADGTRQQFNIEAQIGEQYFKFLNDLLFDSEGNSRLFLQAIPGTGTEGESPEQLPIVLTPTENNGGTIELDRTGSADDVIIAGRLELLHQAYIDGGAGRNILEVEAKGLYAQPLQLLNIQEVRVTDLPNFYTDEENNNTYPVVSGTGSDDSFLDLTRAIGIELLVVSDQGTESGSTASGDLTIVGVRNGAALRLEGGFNSGATTIQYADVSPTGLSVQLNIGDVNDTINILQNSAVLNIESQGVSNFMTEFFAGGRLTNLNISGTGRFGVDGDLDSSFENNTPVTINASANSGGVDLELSGSQNVTILGSGGDDRFTVTTDDVDGRPQNDETVSIIGGLGNNYYEVNGSDIVTITNGDGNNNYEVSSESVTGSVTITSGSGNNVFELENVATAVLTAGNGNNRVELTSFDDDDNAAPSGTPDWVSNIDINFGNGNNAIYVQATSESLALNAGIVDISVGSGINEIAASGRTVTIATTGSGPNSIYAQGEAVTIDNAASTGSTITVAGTGNDFSQVINELGGNSPTGTPLNLTPGNLEPTVLLDIQAGTGATVVLGLESGAAGLSTGSGVTLTALPGSVISGTDLTLEVRTVADVRAADLSGVTGVILDDDNFDIGESTDANNAVAGGNASVLVLTSDQFAEIGAANFSVDGAIFNTHSFIKIIVTESTSLTALGVDALSKNIDLILEVQDGVTLTMTAQQLHTRVAQEGVFLSSDGNDDLADGRVIITGGGINFDPFNTNDQVQSVINGRVFLGGSLSSDFDTSSALVQSVFGGYDRPSNPDTEVVLTIDSDVASAIAGFTTFHNNLEIVGSQDVVFSGPAIRLGVLNPAGEAGDKPFEIFFGDLEGEVVNFTIDNFEYLAQGGGIFGNSETVGDVEIFVNIAADTPGLFGWDEANAESLVSQGVTQYTVTTIDGPVSGGTATIQLCDTVEDLEVIALRGNYQDTLVVVDAAWGLNFELQGGGTAKAEGPTGTSNVGELVANFMWDGADAAVNIIHANPADTRPIFAAGITIDNADSLSIAAPQGDVIISSISGDSLEGLSVTGSGDVTVNADLPDTLESIDFSGVVGESSFTLDDPSADGIIIVGSAGGTTVSLDDVEAGDIASISGAGPVTLVIGENDADLSSTNLANVTDVVLEDGASLTLTFAQADAIGAGNFSVAPGDTASLSLEGLGEQPFAIANYANGITVEVVSVVDQPVVTLNPATDLTGVGSLMVPEGVTLNLTAAQFQQLNGSGAITIINTDGNVANDAINVNITDLAQANVSVPGGFVVNGVNVGLGNLTITLAGNVVFTATADDILEGANGEKAVINIGDDLKLTLANVEQIDEMVINGGTGSSLEFTDITGLLVSVDASGLDVDFLRIPALLASGNNIDFLFQGLGADVTKVIFEGIGGVDGRAQVVNVEEGVTIFGDISFNEYLLDSEVTDLVISLQGGALIDGDLVFSTVQVNGGGTVALVPAYLQQLTINSSGTAANTINGDTANVISGDVTPGAYGPAVVLGSRDNQLKSVLINATQALQIEGAIIFSSHGDDAEGTLNNEPNDLITANDDDSAIAVLVINGTADVTIGSLDTSDGDIDGLNVVNNGTGTLFATLDANVIDASDVFSFTGGDTQLTVEGPVSLSNDVLTAVSQITIADGAMLTLTQAQFGAIGGAAIIDGGDAGNATLNIVNFGSGAFDATTVDPDIVVNLTLASGSTTLNGNFTGVDSLSVVEGSTVTMTAAQFQQLQGVGTINVLDGPDAGTVAGNNGINIVITDLTQANVDAGFDLSLVMVGMGGSVSISLGEPTVTLGTFVDGVLEVGSDANIVTGNNVQADFVLTDGQTLALVNPVQADGLDIDGTGVSTTVVFMFSTAVVFPDQIDASGYDVTDLRALASGFTTGSNNVEYVIDDLSSDVLLTLFENPEQLGFIDPTLRRVVIETGITTPTGLIFNDLDTTDEVRSLTLTLQGGVVLNGALEIPSRTDKTPGDVELKFQSLVVNSDGATTNRINGNISTQTPLGAPNSSVNNLLNVVINAQQDLIIGNDATAPFVFTTGQIIFQAADESGDNNAEANLTVNGVGDVTLKGLDTTDTQTDIDDLTPGDIGTLNVTNNSTGVLTITGGSDAITLGANTTTLTFSGQGDIVLDTAAGAGDNGVNGSGLTLLDASGLTGDLTLGVIEDIDNEAFTLTTGSGVTTATLIDAALDSTGILPSTSDDTAGWLIDYTDAAAGSEFHIAWAGATPVAGSKLTINMGPNGTLFIDGPTGSTVDLSDLVLDINTVQSIVLGDEVTLVLTAQQADGLSIVSGPNTDGDMALGTVNIVDLTDDPAAAPFDLSGIAANIAGTVTFLVGDDDVTLDPATDLGAFSITLADLDGDNTSLDGQTIRFTTFEQADGREILVTDTGLATSSSTNVVWLFETIPGTVDTGDYSNILGRLWVTEGLINSQGGDVEQLFTTLPNSILRVDFSSLTELDILLQSDAIDRVVEFVHFTNLNDLTFSDMGISPEEHIRSLDLRLGGAVTIGNISLDDVVANPLTTDLSTIDFTGITINSRRAVQTDETLAAEQFINDNDGTPETGEFAIPVAANVIGDISVGGGADLLDLLQVTVDTGQLRTTNVGDSVANDGRGEAVVIREIIYDAADAGSTAEADLVGANAITVKSFDFADTDITLLNIDASGHTGLLTVTGGSPAIDAGATGEAVAIATGGMTGADDGNDDLDVALGTAIDTVNNVPFAGIAGGELSAVTVTGNGDVDLGVIALIDSNDDLAVDINGDGDTLDLNESANVAFTLQGNGILNTTAVLGSANVNGVVTAPTLETDQTWILADATVTITEDVTFEVDANLTLSDAAIFIEGVVDLSEVDISINGATTINVSSGNSLTLSFAQLQQIDMVDIVGEGTLVIVGEIPADTDLNLSGHIKTVVVDASLVTIAATDADGELDITLDQPVDDNGDLGGMDGNLGHNVIGSDLDDNIATGAGDDIIDGGAGNDDLDGGVGLNTFNVSEGMDTVASLRSTAIDTIDQEDDVLTVAAGATVVATVTQGGWIADSASSNAGTATLNGLDDLVDRTIDVSLAAGPNGWNIVGNPGASLEIIGSAFGDTINGGDLNQLPGDRDLLTGNGGADTFVFNIDISDPATFTVFEGGTLYDGQATNDAEDYERINIDAGPTPSTGPALVVSYRLNNTVTSINVSTAGVDTTDENEVAQAIADAFNVLLPIDAQTAAGDSTNDVILFTALDGGSFEFLGIGPVPSFTVGDIAFTQEVVGVGSDADDVEQISYLDVDLDDGLATLGERYNLTIELRDGTVVVTDDYIADGTETETDLRDALLLGVQDKLTLIANPIVATAYDNGTIHGIMLEGVDDMGGFTVTDFVASGAFNGSGASSNLVGDVSDLLNADIITDFRAVGSDVIDVGLDAGTGGVSGNLDFALEQASYEDAYLAADASLGGSTVYFFTSIQGDLGLGDGVETLGLLFFDANQDGDPDGLVVLPGIDDSVFNASFIIG